MQVIYTGIALLQLLNFAVGTCVLESEFGFILNCNFKKSGLFRVRNLGGLKAHFGLGFSFGDELGFGESLGNLEGNRRRALNYGTGFVNKVGTALPESDTSRKNHSDYENVKGNKRNISSRTEVMFLPLGVPTFKPIPKAASNVVRKIDLTHNNLNYEDPGVLNVQDNETQLISSDSDPFRIKGELMKGLEHFSKNRDHKYYETDKKLYSDNTPFETFGDRKHLMNLNSEYGNGTKKQILRTMVVMNAPREYYPSGYSKNFDDNFKSKVEIPPNDFRCSQQKYFPGLYANMDLDCMVFHVCAVTERGIVMKSFLCPESTLFDQSILKCNWWFYVDCSSSIYDSNMHFIKSYEVMKSFSYFANQTNALNLHNTEKMSGKTKK